MRDTLFDWGIPLIIAVVALIVFLALARETKVVHRIARGILGSYYVYYTFWLLLSGFKADSLLLSVTSLIFLIPAYFFSIVGHKYDLQKVRREAKAKAEVALFRDGPPETHWSPEPIVGYRATIHSYGGERFLHQPAKCRYMGISYRGQHDSNMAPTWGCSCGYYAMKDLRNVPGGFKVIVLMWGRVIEHEDGYRASHMRPIGFIGRAPVITGGEPIEVSTFDSPFRQTYTPVADQNYCLGFQNLPVVRDQESHDALIEKALKEFDPEYIPPYDGGHNGYRKADTQN